MSREYPLTVYGKLPLSKEFLRLRCGGGAQRALYQWINEGHDASVARGNGRPLETDVRWRLVSFADGFSELNVGVIRGSTDHGGLRKFPFCVYVAVDRELLPPQPGPALIALAPLWDDLVRMEREISSIEALDAFKAAARDATVSFVTKFGEPRSAWESSPLPGVIASIARGIAPGGDAGRVFTNHLHELAGAVRILDSKKIPGAKLPALRLPIGSGVSPTLQAGAWLACLATCDFIRARKTPVTVAIPESVTDSGSAWVVIRPPRPVDFGVFGGGRDSFFFPDPGGRIASVQEEPFAAFADRVAASLLKPGATLLDLAEFRLV